MKTELQKIRRDMNSLAEYQSFLTNKVNELANAILESQKGQLNPETISKLKWLIGQTKSPK